MKNVEKLLRVLMHGAFYVASASLVPGCSVSIQFDEADLGAGGMPEVPEEPEEPGESDVPITDVPATEGQSLFVRSSDPGQNIAGFEFCCAQYDTYQEHGFTDAQGDFIKLDGGFWGADIAGHIGERVFSSYGDGYEDDTDTTAAQLGPGATGEISSPAFVITKDYINFLIGGGRNRFDGVNATAVVLIVDGAVVRQAPGNDEENEIVWTSWDVRDLEGQTAVVKFIDHHPNDGSDTAVPYILADEFRAADKAAVAPPAASKVPATPVLSAAPASEGASAFTRVGNPGQNIAGFEFCCGGYNTYQEHGFVSTGDIIRLNGGQWGADIAGTVGERLFASYGPGFADDMGSSGVDYGWEATGTMTSPQFTVTTRYLNLLIGGGTNAYDQPLATAVVLRVNGKIVRHATGNGMEKQLSWVSWDVSALIGQTAVIEIIDRHDNSASTGACPFILVDEIRAANKAAVAPVPSSIVSTAEGHTQLLNLDMADANPYYENGVYYIYYLQNLGFHSWALAKTSDLLNSTFPQEVLPASGDASRQDQFVGSGSVLKAQDGQYHLFYSGHNADHAPVEAVMHATAADNTLTKWTPVAADTFSGSAGYSDFDFRDPFVYWNQSAGKYWMLITTRHSSQAAIGLYTSTNLSNWSAEPPLYIEASPLNFEVADQFTLGDTPYIVYSDQRDASRQVKYLQQSGANWIKPSFDALDGKWFYAARSAGTAGERLLFGWVPHTVGRVDHAGPDFGGSLMVHQVASLGSGALAVSMPQRIRDGLAAIQPIAMEWSAGGVSAIGTTVNMEANSAFTLAELGVKNRMAFKVTSANAGSTFGIQLRREISGQPDERAFLKIDASADKAEFYFQGEEGAASNPKVAVPLDSSDGIDIEVLLDPVAGVGAVYLNRNRALSFRLYALANYQVGLFSNADGLTVTDLSRYTK
ncbi:MULTISPECIES: glycoside hydrolase family 32 protein [Hydrocarboniphaga]|uniref:glycoside hydrolase family 32 protein n=1 Tax=Hydrocarboniphaga TaxID=243627 RepID=UPI0002E147B8|nr:MULTISPECIES: glycoside hydrolase family 32 protein [Hydrocarboniphaga]MDZ4079719.1 glycoside hydrolase family 32 protein [Hydrocarboniphaga sp.]